MASGPSQDVVSYFTQEGGSPTYLWLELHHLPMYATKLSDMYALVCY
jgi:hypothetical protein